LNQLHRFKSYLTDLATDNRFEENGSQLQEMTIIVCE